MCFNYVVGVGLTKMMTFEQVPEAEEGVSVWRNCKEPLRQWEYSMKMPKVGMVVTSRVRKGI